MRSGLRFGVLLPVAPHNLEQAPCGTIARLLACPAGSVLTLVASTPCAAEQARGIDHAATLTAALQRSWRLQLLGS